MDDCRTQLAGWLAYHQDQRHLIALQDYPDSDALLTAAAHQKISRRFSIETDIVVASKLAHPHHRALADLLGMSIMVFRDAFGLDAYDGAIFFNDPRLTDIGVRHALQEADVPTVLIVSHGSSSLLEEAETIVVPEGKAASSLYASFLQRAGSGEPGWTIGNKGKPRSAKRSKSSSGTAADSLRRNRNSRNGATLAQQGKETTAATYSSNVMEVLRRALTTRASHKDLSAAGVGYLSAEDIESLAIAAELLTREEGIERAIVFAITRGPRAKEQLHGVYWNAGGEDDPSGFLRSIFEDDSFVSRFHAEDRVAGSFSLPLGRSSRDLAKETQMMQWSYYEILTLKRIANALLDKPR